MFWLAACGYQGQGTLAKDFSLAGFAAQPGAVVRASLPGVRMPTGAIEHVPALIVQGNDPQGPTGWISTGVHGDEHTGLIVLHELIRGDLAQRLRGTLVLALAVTPSGFNMKKRVPFTTQTDPNRLFPDPARESSATVIGAQEAAFRELYDQILSTEPAFLIDLHNAWVGTIPFALRDPVFYRRGAGGRSRRDAQRLQDETGRLLSAFGFSTINEFAASTYITRGLHRSLSGAVLNGGGIPSFTVELGSWMHVDPGVVQAACAGLRNVLRSLGMLNGEPEPVTGIPTPQPGYPVRRVMYPVAPASGVVHWLARAGDLVSKGQPLARMVDIYGQGIGEEDGLLRSDHEGFVIGWVHGVLRFQGESLMSLAVRDEGEMVLPYPIA